MGRLGRNHQHRASLWAVASVIVALTVALGVDRWSKPGDQGRGVYRGVASTAAPPEVGTRRQVQLVAPGGTRVIWVFNADFSLKEK